MFNTRQNLFLDFLTVEMLWFRKTGVCSIQKVNKLLRTHKEPFYNIKNSDV